MNDVTTDLLSHTKKYHIPLTHIEHRYIEYCTDGTELERIYKELIGGEVGTFPLLEQLTLDRIRNVQPNSEILRRDKLPFDRLQHMDTISSCSTLRDDENHTHNSIASLSNHTGDTSTSVINNDIERTVPKSNVEWETHAQNASGEFNTDDDDNESFEESERRRIAKDHRFNANVAFKSHDYEQSIDLYTQSLGLEENIIAHLNRAAAYFKLDNFDASIQDCLQILAIDFEHTKALYHRAVCYCAKEQYDEAKRDLDDILTIDADNHEAQDLLNKIFTIQQMDTNRTTGQNEKLETQASIMALLDIEDEPVNHTTTHSMSVNIPSRQNNHFNSDSPPTFRGTPIDQFQISTSNDDDGGIALGDEAGGGFTENLSDEDGHISRSINVSPSMDDDSEPPELINHKPLQTPPLTPLYNKINTTDKKITCTVDQDTKRNPLSTISYNHTNNDHHNLYDNYNIPSISNHFSSHKQNTSSLMNTNDTYVQSTSIDDAISNSSFGPTIQSWLRDLVASQSTRRSSSFYERPWTRSPRPWSLDNIHRDMGRFLHVNDYRNALEVSRKMLHNGILDYHYHAEDIVNILFNCSECYFKLNDYARAIQYATEALQYDKTDSDALICRARTFEKENLLLFSYADYASIPENSFSYHTAQRACERLSIESEVQTWREKLPTIDERFFIYFKFENQSYDWYRTNGDQFYHDACFVLAIRCYTSCLILQPDDEYAYLQRAACYLNIFEPKKAIDDCEMVLKGNQTNCLALYRKASAYKISRDDRLYELTLKEYIKLQPHNQIVLAEYYKCRYESIPRKRRRIRVNSIASKVNDENHLSYEQLEQIRTDERLFDSSFDWENSNDMKEQCSFILHSFLSIHSVTNQSIEIIVRICRLMIEAEEHYQQEHQSIILPYSYIKSCFTILLHLTTLPQIEIAVAMIDEHTRKLLDELVEYYSSMSPLFNESEKLNRLTNL